MPSMPVHNLANQRHLALTYPPLLSRPSLSPILTHRCARASRHHNPKAARLPRNVLITVIAAAPTARAGAGSRRWRTARATPPRGTTATASTRRSAGAPRALCPPTHKPAPITICGNSAGILRRGCAQDGRAGVVGLYLELDKPPRKSKSSPRTGPSPRPAAPPRRSRRPARIDGAAWRQRGH